MNYIEDFVYRRMWDRYNLEWHNLRKDVNILVGINGKGKTTLLDAINNYYNKMLASKASKKKAWNFTELCCVILNAQINRASVLDNNGFLLLEHLHVLNVHFRGVEEHI